MGHTAALRNIVTIAATAVAVRLGLILAFPIVYGGDSLLRLVNHDRILISYQLPLLQLLIWIVTRFFTSVFAVRLLMVAIGAFSAIAFYRFTLVFVTPRAAMAGALLFATNPFITAISCVPYQEILLLGCLSYALCFLFQNRDLAASVWLGLACLTRFEAWVACPIFMATAWRRGRPFWQSALLFAWAPLLWLAFRKGLSEPGTFVLDRSFSLDRFYRIPFLAGHTFVNATIATIVLAAFGLYATFRQGRYRDPRLRALAALLGLFALAILFSAHGEPPDVNRYVTTREIHIPLMLVILLAAMGCAAYPRLAVPLTAAGIALGILGAYRFIARETSRPEIRLGYELARYLDTRVQPGENIAILSPPIDYWLYFRRLRETGGEVALQSAQKVLSEIDTSPLDLQRTRIHSRLPASRFQPAPVSNAQWVAVWSTYVPADDSGAQLTKEVRAHPDWVLTVSDISVYIRRFTD